MDGKKQKPPFEEVLAYAKKQVKYYIAHKASHLPREQQEEIMQDAYQRIWQAYANLDPDQGWKSFIQLHSQGAVLDYLKSGLNDTESEVDQERVEIYSKEDNEPLSVDEVAGFFGIFSDLDKTENKMKPNWDLLSRLVGFCQKDGEDLHIVCKVLLGYSQEAIAAQLGISGEGVTRERISQRVREFMMKLDDPAYLDNKFVNQCIFALGLSSFFSMAPTDNGLGWNLKEFDLNAENSFDEVRKWYNPTFFDYAEGLPQ